MRAKFVNEAIKHLAGPELTPEELKKFKNYNPATGYYYCNQCGTELINTDEINVGRCEFCDPSINPTNLSNEGIKHLTGHNLSDEEIKRFEEERNWNYNCDCGDVEVTDDLCSNE